MSQFSIGIGESKTRLKYMYIRVSFNIPSTALGVLPDIVHEGLDTIVYDFNVRLPWSVQSGFFPSLPCLKLLSPSKGSTPGSYCPALSVPPPLLQKKPFL
jgi:hypothetical protein